MFITHKNNVKPFTLEKNVVSVAGIELMAYQPWFLCEIPETDEVNKIICFTTFLIPDVDTLATIAKNNKPTKAYMVSPGYVNNSQNWEMQPVKTISQAACHLGKGTNIIHRFETENGHAYDQDVSRLSESIDDLDFHTILQFD